MTKIVQYLETRPAVTGGPDVVSLAWSSAGRRPEERMPWGGIGQRVDSAMTFREALTLSRISEVDAAAQRETLHDVRGALIPGRRVIRRTDTGAVLGVVSRTYEDVPYAQAFEPFTLAGHPVDTAAVLGRGEQAYLTLRLGDVSPIGPRGGVARFLVVHTGRDGETPRTASLTTISVVCANTLTAAVGDGSLRRVSHQHRGRLVQSGGAVEQAFADALAAGQRQDQAYRELAARPVTEADVETVIRATWGTRNEAGRFELVSAAGQDARLQVLDAFEHRDLAGQPTGVVGNGTAWDLLQAGTFALDRWPESKRKVTEGDAGEAVTGTRASWLRSEASEAISGYRQRLTDALVGLAAGRDVEQLVMA